MTSQLIKSVPASKVETAAKEANAHDFIMGFPDGYQTQVGEAGTQVGAIILWTPNFGWRFTLVGWMSF